ncbi:AraC family transcriptional regulator [Nitrobacteraceae bacterium UC4446_H13]
MTRSTSAVDYQDLPRPIAAMAVEYSAGHRGPYHSHRRAQLLYGSNGVLRVATPDGTWVAPTNQAIWIPGDIMHQVICHGAVSFRTLYIEPDASELLPRACRVLDVSDLLRALILELVSLPLEYNVDGREGRVMALIIDELCRMPARPMHIPMPRSPRLRQICEAFLGNPSSRDDIDEWAARAGLSRRTFTRLFRLETKMSVGTWKKQARLIEAVTRIASGASITSVAFDIGYESSSAFSAMFRQSLGTSPSAFSTRRL